MDVRWFGGLGACCSVVVPVGCYNVGFLCYDCLECLDSCVLWLLIAGLRAVWVLLDFGVFAVACRLGFVCGWADCGYLDRFWRLDSGLFRQCF